MPALLGFGAVATLRLGLRLGQLPSATGIAAEREAGDTDHAVAENDGQVGFGVIMLRKMADGRRRPNPPGKSRGGG
jgi:hypothetical protein